MQKTVGIDVKLLILAIKVFSAFVAYKPHILVSKRNSNNVSVKLG